MKVWLGKIGKHLNEKQYACICGLITLGLMLLGFFAFPNALGRLVESIIDIGYSIAYTFCELLDIEHTIPVKVNDYPDYTFLNVRGWIYSLFGGSLSTPTYKVIFWDDIVEGWKKYWAAWIDTDNMLLYCYYVAYYVTTYLPIILLAIPIAWGVKKLFKKYYFKPHVSEEETIEESKTLKGWHKFYFMVITRVEAWFIGLFYFAKEREELHQFWLLLLFLYFNVFTIMFEFAAYYIYFAVSLDVINLYRQGYKLFLDLSGVFAFFGWISWITLLILVVNRRAQVLLYRQEDLDEVYDNAV